MLQAFARAILWNFLNLYDTLEERKKVLRTRRMPDDLILSQAPTRMPPILFPDYNIQTKQSFTRANRKVDVIDFGKDDSSALGYGWYELERSQVDSNMIFRWTRDEAIAYISLSEPSILKLEVFGIPQFIGKPIQGRILVNEFDVGCFEIRHDGWQVISFRLDRFIETTCEIRIQVTTPWRPSRVFRNRDLRLLGIGVRKIWLEKMSEAKS